MENLRFIFLHLMGTSVRPGLSSGPQSYFILVLQTVYPDDLYIVVSRKLSYFRDKFQTFASNLTQTMGTLNSEHVSCLLSLLFLQ